MESLESLSWTEVPTVTAFATDQPDYNDYVSNDSDIISNWSQISIQGDESINFSDLNGTIWGIPIYFEKDTAEFVVFLVNGILISGVSLFGIFGNILSASVLSKKRMQSSLSVLLLGLSFCDLIVCTLTFFWIGLPYILWMFRIGEWYISSICYVFHYYFLFWTVGK